MPRPILVAVAAAALLIALTAAGTASARNLTFLNGERGFLIGWSTIEMANNIESNVVRCHVHLEGSFTRRSMVKFDRTVTGRVTRAISNECANGSLIVNGETLPWDVRYRGFSGTLPIITLIFLDLPNLSFRIEFGSNRCESNAEDRNPMRMRAVLVEDGTGLRKLTTVRADESASVPLRGGLFGSCALARWIFRGEATTNVLGETAAITVALI